MRKIDAVRKPERHQKCLKKLNQRDRSRGRESSRKKTKTTIFQMTKMRTLRVMAVAQKWTMEFTIAIMIKLKFYRAIKAGFKRGLPGLGNGSMYQIVKIYNRRTCPRPTGRVTQMTQILKVRNISTARKGSVTKSWRPNSSGEKFKTSFNCCSKREGPADLRKIVRFPRIAGRRILKKMRWTITLTANSPALKGFSSPFTKKTPSLRMPWPKLTKAIKIINSNISKGEP